MPIVIFTCQHETATHVYPEGFELECSDEVAAELASAGVIEGAKSDEPANKSKSKKG